MNWETEANKEWEELQVDMKLIDFIEDFYIFLREDLRKRGLKVNDINAIVRKVKFYVKYQNKATKNR